MDLILRAYTEQKPNNNGNNKKVEHLPNVMNYLVFDCETSANQYQNLTFGSFRVYENNQLIETGIFYNPKIVTDLNLDILKKLMNGHFKI